jgi:hypothetical protein
MHCIKIFGIIWNIEGDGKKTSLEGTDEAQG